MIRFYTALFFLLLCGCRDGDKFVVAKLNVERLNWDSLRVSISFTHEAALGTPRRALADEKRIVAFNTAYDTLYAGSDTVFAIPDRDLGNNERILLEVCGLFPRTQVCEQHTVLASPKRVRIEPDITYPVRNLVYQGQYQLPFVIERQQFGEESWEPVTRSARLEGHMIAYVEGRENESIQVPFSNTKGGFNLANQANYKDFKFYLDSALLDHNQANVRFDIYVDMSGIVEPVGSISKNVANKSDEENQRAVALFAEAAADQVVDQLNPFLGRRRNVVYIDRWNYNVFKRMYEVEMEIRWSGTLFTRNDYRLNGILEVYDDGKRVLFRMTDADRQARRRWESRNDGAVMTLASIDATPGDSIQIRTDSPFYEQNGVVVIEAEHFDDAIPFHDQSWERTRNRRGHRGEAAVVVEPDRDVRIRSRYEGRSPELSYRISFSRAGTYYLWLRVWADDDNGNSAHMGLDGRAFRSAAGIQTLKYQEWAWTRDLMDEPDPASLRIPKPGSYTLNLWMREDGFYVDRILLTTDRSYIPSENGPNESPREPGSTHPPANSTSVTPSF